MGAGWRWKATPFTPGWVEVRPVFSRVRDLYRRARGWSRNAYLGGYTFVRRRDGLVVVLGSNPLEFVYEVFEDVFIDIGDNADAGELVAEIVARSRAYWGDDLYETDLHLEF